jgi:hypothetical protein
VEELRRAETFEDLVARDRLRGPQPIRRTARAQLSS